MISGDTYNIFPSSPSLIVVTRGGRDGVGCDMSADVRGGVEGYRQQHLLSSPLVCLLPHVHAQRAGPQQDCPQTV